MLEARRWIWLGALLWAAVLAHQFWQLTLRDDLRRLQVELRQNQELNRALQGEYRLLRLEERFHTHPIQLEALARRQLGMVSLQEAVSRRGERLLVVRSER
ncbi:MAG: cell division protein FtsL [Gammaproteobacteria bacterium AqS3]|nr:cell division protein FtsL [Gammaproteobacteria bacterium AqS3]